MKASIRHILTDGLILFTVSTVLVVVADMGFKQLKEKGVKESAIVNAIHTGKPDTLAKVLAQDPKSIAERDAHGRSPLSIACYSNIGDRKVLGELDATRAALIPDLITAGADIDHPDSDLWTPIMWASWSGLANTCETLIAKNAAVSSADRLGNTALMLAARRGHADIVETLLKHGADKAPTNRDGLSALDVARLGLTELPDRKADFQRILAALSPKTD